MLQTKFAFESLSPFKKFSLLKKKISFIDHSIEYEYLLLVPNERMEKSINNRRTAIND